MKTVLSHPSVTLISRAIIGIVFVLFSVDKIAAPDAFAASIQAYQLVPTFFINIIAIILPWVELVCGLFLVAGIFIRANAAILSVLLVMFLMGMGTAMARDLNIDCGCFGPEHATPIGWPRIIEDAGLLLLGLQLFFYPKSALSVE